MDATFGVGGGERVLQRDLSLGYAAAGNGPRTRRSARQQDAPGRQPAPPGATDPARKSVDSPVRAVATPRPASVTGAGGVSVWATPADGAGSVELFESLTDEVPVGQASGRMLLFYPMIRTADERVFMEHRIVNPLTGELSSKYALIQTPGADPLVTDFQLG